MFLPQPQPQKIQEIPIEKPGMSVIVKNWQSWQDSFFLLICGSGSLAMTNLVRIYPAYFWLYVIFMIVTIVALLFFPEKRLGSLVTIAGIVLASWEFIAAFKFQQVHFAIAGVIALVILVAIATIGGKE